MLPVSKFSPAKSRNMCKSCSTKYDRIRARKIKDIIINELGGECLHCGYNKSQAALDLHHSSPEKDFTWVEIRKMAEYRILDFVRKEKLVLLCSNCHREEHDKLRDLDYTFGVPDDEPDS